MLNRAIEIAAKAHAEQVDKGGNPYIMHPLRVMINFCGDSDEETKICAVLHDVVEDTDVTLEDLRAEGFSDEVISALDCLTKRKGESYDDFISRILANMMACKVKYGDLADNTNLTRIPNPTAKDRERIVKYKKAADRIFDVLAVTYKDKTTNRRLISLNGMVEVHDNITLDYFNDAFIEFVESHGWFFGGSCADVTDEESEDVLEELA